jgi:glucose/arabinose dehydrogenase
MNRSAIAAALILGGAMPLCAQGISASSTATANLKVETIARGLEHPWALAFLPDGRMLVTERPGRLRILTRIGQLSPPIPGVPEVFAVGQGGLLDLTLDRDFERNRTIYFCYAERENDGGRTTLARARLIEEGTPRLDNVRTIFRQHGQLSPGLHFGCRIVHMPDGNLFLTTGEHGPSAYDAQGLDNHLGKLIRVRPDGSVPPDNPFAKPGTVRKIWNALLGNPLARPEIWSYGHRNMQGAAIHPTTGKLWTVEHGPQGGDEINIPAAGKNYGWPIVGYGIDYTGQTIHKRTHRWGMEQPIRHWVPSIAPSGMAFYTGQLFPAWRGNLFVGALAGQALVRLELAGEKVVKEERLLTHLKERIRDVRQGPDGALYLVTDHPEGRILRVSPAK